MKPLSNNITVEPRENDRVLSSGIIIPDTCKLGNTEYGEVVAVSGDLNLKKGDRVLYFNSRCFEGEHKVVEHKKIISWWRDGQQRVLEGKMLVKEIHEESRIISKKDIVSGEVACVDSHHVISGDKIMYRSNTGTKVNVDRVDYLLMNISSILYIK